MVVIFSSAYRLPFILFIYFTISFREQMVLVLMKSNLSIFSFKAIFLYTKKYLPQGLKYFLLDI